MRFTTICLGFTATTVLTLVQAQELAAPEEWFESMKLARGLIDRQAATQKAQQQQQQATKPIIESNTGPASHLKRRSLDLYNSLFKRYIYPGDVSAAVAPSSFAGEEIAERNIQGAAASGGRRLQKRRMGYPSRLEVEQRATAFNYFRADELVQAPANLRVVKAPKVGKAKAGKKVVKKVVKGAQKLEKKAKKLVAKDKKIEKRAVSGKQRKVRMNKGKKQQGKKAQKKQT